VLEKVGVGRNCVVLDFGCGSGTHAIPAARLASAGGKVYALDRNGIVLKRLEGAARRDGLRSIETILSSDLETGLEDGSVDVVLLHDVIHMIDEKRALLAELHRVLKPAGRVSVYPMHVDKDEVSRQMRDSGFSLHAEEYEGHLLIFRKAEQGPVD
jgi:ubiquinone/menaquinone biosynthesis C-methylase UbiE